MEVFIWILCLVIGGSTAFECNNFDCGESPLEDLENLEYRPKEADLIRLCPKTLDFLNCFFRNAKECFGMEVEEIAENGDEMAKIIARFFLNAKHLADELCDEQSTLRKTYLEHIDCFESLFSADLDVASVCTEKGETFAKAFLMQKHNLVDGNVPWTELDCLERVYNLACFSEQLETTCGEVATQTFLNILGNFKTQVSFECHVENPLDLKRSFLEYLNLDDHFSQMYKSIFDTYRRR